MGIDLLRHGATTLRGHYCGSTDAPLTMDGMAAMLDAVQGRRWQRIVSSPLTRCADFAESLAAQLGVPCRIDARLRELHFGSWEGRHPREIPEAELGAFWADPLGAAPPGSESLRALQSRVFAAWLELAEDAVSTLVVTHGGPIRVLLALERGLPLTRSHEIEVPLAGLIRLPSPALTAFAAPASGVSLH